METQMETAFQKVGDYYTFDPKKCHTEELLTDLYSWSAAQHVLGEGGGHRNQRFLLSRFRTIWNKTPIDCIDYAILLIWLTSIYTFLYNIIVSNILK